MRAFVRCLAEYRGLWPIWLPLLAVAAIVPLLAVTMPLLEKRLVDEVMLQGRLDLLPGTVGAYAAVWLLLTGTGVVRGLLQTCLHERGVQHLRWRLFTHCGTLSLAFSHREHTGRTTALYHHDVPGVAAVFSSTAVAAVGSLVGIGLGVAIMFHLHRQLAVAAGVAPLLAGGVAVLVTRPLRPAARRVQEKAAELSERLQEHLAGIREVTAFTREQTQAREFGAAQQELLGLRMRLTLMNSAFHTGQSLFSLAVAVVILGYGGYLVLQGDTTIGTLVAMRTLFGQLFEPAGRLFGLVKDVQTALASADRLFAFFDEQPHVTDTPRLALPHPLRGEVAFEGVGFAYQPDRPVLHDVTFLARPGQTIALVGPSGAGKSTLVGLIARFYDPVAGRVLLDGHDLRHLPLADLRRQVGIVFQDTFLFARTVGANIAFGREGATEAEVAAAARAAYAWEFIERLPQGLDTPVGQRGARLSEGQRQRLAIARALLRDPRVLILDEPTSALDARSEHLLQAALENLMRGRTSFVIAHRLATVQRADRILVLDGGRIVQAGTHHDLARRPGLYRQLCSLQFGPAGLPPVPDDAEPVPSPPVAPSRPPRRQWPSPPPRSVARPGRIVGGRAAPGPAPAGEAPAQE